MQKTSERVRENNPFYMNVKKYSNSDTIQCSDQSNIRILFVSFPFLCFRLSLCGFKDTVDLRVPAFYFVTFYYFFFHVKLSTIDLKKFVAEWRNNLTKMDKPL